ncbi:hypothetical protein K2X30_07065 [bacterium]|jgi:hypothetical protein|nr:hypothetical protein [bacterium]
MENREITKTIEIKREPINLLNAIEPGLEKPRKIIPPAFIPKLPKGEVIKAATKTVAKETKSLMHETFMVPVQPHLEQLKKDLSPLIEFFERHPVYKGLAYVGMGLLGLFSLSYLTINYGLYILYLLA